MRDMDLDFNMRQCEQWAAHLTRGCDDDDGGGGGGGNGITWAGAGCVLCLMTILQSLRQGQTSARLRGPRALRATRRESCSELCVRARR